MYPVFSKTVCSQVAQAKAVRREQLNESGATNGETERGGRPAGQRGDENDHNGNDNEAAPEQTSEGGSPQPPREAGAQTGASSKKRAKRRRKAPKRETYAATFANITRWSKKASSYLLAAKNDAFIF